MSEALTREQVEELVASGIDMGSFDIQILGHDAALRAERDDWKLQYDLLSDDYRQMSISNEHIRAERDALKKALQVHAEHAMSTTREQVLEIVASIEGWTEYHSQPISHMLKRWLATDAALRAKVELHNDIMNELKREMEKFGMEFTDEYGRLYPPEVISKFITDLTNERDALKVEVQHYRTACASVGETDGPGWAETTNELKRQLAAREAQVTKITKANALLREASFQSHSGHWDNTGGSGSGCSECIRSYELMNEAEALTKAGTLP